MRDGCVCRIWRRWRFADGAHALAITRGGHAKTRAERPREAAAVVETARRGDLTDHHGRALQQVRRAFDAQARGGGLRALVVEREEGLGEVPAGEAGELGQFADADDAVAVAFQEQAGALQATEDLALAVARPARAARHPLGELALRADQVQEQRAQLRDVGHRAPGGGVAPQAQGDAGVVRAEAAAAGVEGAVGEAAQGAQHVGAQAQADAQPMAVTLHQRARILFQRDPLAALQLEAAFPGLDPGAAPDLDPDREATVLKLDAAQAGHADAACLAGIGHVRLQDLAAVGPLCRFHLSTFAVQEQAYGFARHGRRLQENWRRVVRNPAESRSERLPMRLFPFSSATWITANRSAPAASTSA